MVILESIEALTDKRAKHVATQTKGIAHISLIASTSRHIRKTALIVTLIKVHTDRRIFCRHISIEAITPIESNCVNTGPCIIAKRLSRCRAIIAATFVNVSAVKAISDKAALTRAIVRAVSVETSGISVTLVHDGHFILTALIDVIALVVLMWKLFKAGQTLAPE